MMQNIPFLERRTFPRFTIALPLTCSEFDFNKKIEAKTLNISAVGLCIITDIEAGLAVIPGDYLDVYLQVTNNGEWIYRKGKVVWSEPVLYSKYKFGIQLEEPKIKPISIILKILKSKSKD
jgi:hypothetical protein